MTVTCLLMLAAAAVGTDGFTFRPRASGSADVQAASVSQSEPFATAPLQLGRPSLQRHREYFALSPPDANVKSVFVGVPAQQRHADTVCTMQVIRVEPTFDAGIVRSVRTSRLDRIVRDDLAACAP